MLRAPEMELKVIFHKLDFPWKRWVVEFHSLNEKSPSDRLKPHSAMYKDFGQIVPIVTTKEEIMPEFLVFKYGSLNAEKVCTL